VIVIDASILNVAFPVDRRALTSPGHPQLGRESLHSHVAAFLLLGGRSRNLWAGGGFHAGLVVVSLASLAGASRSAEPC